MRIGVVGGTGFVGGHILKQAKAGGHDVVCFSRREIPSGDGIEYRVIRDRIDLSGIEVVMNLAGESIMGLWTKAKRERIRESRISTTRKVVASIGEVGDRPAVLVNASAVGFYGNTGDVTADEEAAAGQGFLGEVAAEWEREAMLAEPLGLRVVRMRIGMVLGEGGALLLMRPVFKAGLGGVIGSGEQWMSWIHVDDVARAFLFCAENEHVEGAVNAVAPEPVRNRDFTKTVARAANRPAFLPAPGWALRSALGEFSTLLLDSQRVVPKKLEASGFIFKHPALDETLASLF